jgi:hypothetical protein
MCAWRTEGGKMTDDIRSPLQLLTTQYSHVLFVLNNSRAGRESQFLEWYQGTLRERVRSDETVLRAEHYEQHEVDITCGRHMPIPYRYLGLYHISIDGAEQSERLIDSVHSLFRDCEHADVPATWLFYPISEKVGRLPPTPSSMLTVAYANPTPGEEAAFREWYSTRHIRHALKIPALVSGQCFERTIFQRSGPADCGFTVTAIYEQEGTPEEIIESFATLPKDALSFPMLDRRRGRFRECVYRPI